MKDIHWHPLVFYVYNHLNLLIIIGGDVMNNIYKTLIKSSCKNE